MGDNNFLIKPSVLSFAVAQEINSLKAQAYQAFDDSQASQASMAHQASQAYQAPYLLENARSLQLLPHNQETNDSASGIVLLGICERLIFTDDSKHSYALAFVLTQHLDEPTLSLIQAHYEHIKPILAAHNIEPYSSNLHCYPIMVPWPDSFNDLARNSEIFSTPEHTKLLMLALSFVPEAPFVKLNNIYPLIKAQEATANYANGNGTAPTASQEPHFNLALSMLLDAHFKGLDLVNLKIVSDSHDANLQAGSNTEDWGIELKLDCALELEHMCAQLLLNDDVGLFATIYYQLTKIFKDNTDLNSLTLNKLSELESILQNSALSLTVDSVYNRAKRQFSSFKRIDLYEHTDATPVLKENVIGLLQAFSNPTLGVIDKEALVSTNLNSSKILAAQSYGEQLKALLSTNLSCADFYQNNQSESTQESRSNYLELCASSHLNALESALASNAMGSHIVCSAAMDSAVNSIPVYADNMASLADIFEVQSLLVIERYQLTVVKSFTPLSLSYHNVAPVFLLLLNAGYNLQASALHYLALLMMSDYLIYDLNSQQGQNDPKYQCLLNALFSQEESALTSSFLQKLTNSHNEIRLFNSYLDLALPEELSSTCKHLFSQRPTNIIVDKTLDYDPTMGLIVSKLANSGLLSMLLSKIDGFDAFKLPYSLQCRFFGGLTYQDSNLIFSYLNRILQNRPNSNLAYALMVLWIISIHQQDSKTTSQYNLILTKLEELYVNLNNLTKALTELGKQDLISLYGLLKAYELIYNYEDNGAELLRHVLKDLLTDVPLEHESYGGNLYFMLTALHIRLNSHSLNTSDDLECLKKLKCTEQQCLTLAEHYQDLAFISLFGNMDQLLNNPSKTTVDLLISLLFKFLYSSTNNKANSNLMSSLLLGYVNTKEDTPPRVLPAFINDYSKLLSFLAAKDFNLINSFKSLQPSNKRAIIINLAKEPQAMGVLGVLYRNFNRVSALHCLDESSFEQFITALVSNCHTKIKVYLLTTLLKDMNALLENNQISSQGVVLTKEQIHSLGCRLLSSFCQCDAIETSEYQDACFQDKCLQDEVSFTNIAHDYNKAMHKLIGYVVSLDKFNPKSLNRELRKLATSLSDDLSITCSLELYYRFDIRFCYRNLFNMLISLGSEKYLARNKSKQSNSGSKSELNDRALSIIFQTLNKFSNNDIKDCHIVYQQVALASIAILPEFNATIFARELLKNGDANLLSSLNSIVVALSELNLQRKQKTSIFDRQGQNKPENLKTPTLILRGYDLLKYWSEQYLDELSLIMTTGRLISWCLTLHHINLSLNRQNLGQPCVEALEKFEQSCFEQLTLRDDLPRYLSVLQSEHYLNSSSKAS